MPAGADEVKVDVQKGLTDDDRIAYSNQRLEAGALHVDGTEPDVNQNPIALRSLDDVCMMGVRHQLNRAVTGGEYGTRTWDDAEAATQKAFTERLVVNGFLRDELTVDGGMKNEAIQGDDLAMGDSRALVGAFRRGRLHVSRTEGSTH